MFPRPGPLPDPSVDATLLDALPFVKNFVGIRIHQVRMVEVCGHYFINTKPFLYSIHKKGSSYQSIPSAGILTSTACS